MSLRIFFDGSCSRSFQNVGWNNGWLMTPLYNSRSRQPTQGRVLLDVQSEQFDEKRTQTKAKQGQFTSRSWPQSSISKGPITYFDCVTIHNSDLDGSIQSLSVVSLPRVVVRWVGLDRAMDDTRLDPTLTSCQKSVIRRAMQSNCCCLWCCYWEKIRRSDLI